MKIPIDYQALIEALKPFADCAEDVDRTGVDNLKDTHGWTFQAQDFRRARAALAALVSQPQPEGEVLTGAIKAGGVIHEGHEVGFSSIIVGKREFTPDQVRAALSLCLHPAPTLQGAGK